MAIRVNVEFTDVTTFSKICKNTTKIVDTGRAVGARDDCTLDVFIDHGRDYLSLDFLGDIRRNFDVVVN